jgi:hypothetical protein
MTHVCVYICINTHPKVAPVCDVVEVLDVLLVSKVTQNVHISVSSLI